MIKYFMKNLDYESLEISPKEANTDRYLFLNYEHDAALLNWFKEKRRLELDQSFLITIDAHIDLSFLEEKVIARLKKYRDSFASLTEEQLIEFISSQFHPHSVSFIVAAMELGIVGDVLIISPNHNRVSWRDDKEISHRRLRCLKTKFKIYKDSSGSDHKVYFIPYMYHLGGGNKGIMTDIVDEKKRKLRDQILNSNLIIDIDFDYCTYTRDFKTFVISGNNFKWEFKNEIFVDLLVNHADVISMALEPVYCGNDNNIKKISGYFGYLFQYCEILDEPDRLRHAVSQILLRGEKSPMND